MSKKNIALFVAIPIFLLSCANSQNKGVTFKLLWGTEIKPVANNTKIVANQNYTTIAKYNENGSISDDFKVMAITDTHLDPEQDVGNATYTMMIKNIMNQILMKF